MHIQASIRWDELRSQSTWGPTGADMKPCWTLHQEQILLYESVGVQRPHWTQIPHDYGNHAGVVLLEGRQRYEALCTIDLDASEGKIREMSK